MTNDTNEPKPDRRAITSAVNGKRGGRPPGIRKSIRAGECSCGRLDGTHHHKCVVFWRWYRARRSKITLDIRLS